MSNDLEREGDRGGGERERERHTLCDEIYQENNYKCVAREKERERERERER